MQIKNMPQYFKKAEPILTKIEKAGFQAYFVGGSVRDTLIKSPIHDVDIASSAYPQEIKQLFHYTVDTGIKHGTVMVIYHGTGYEITTFRTESGYQDYRRPKHVTFVRSLPEDLKRRDFTINALAMDGHGKIVDLFDGIGDLKRRLIKAVGNPNRRFHEDALRMMRAVRFASKLDFQIEPQTLAAIKKYSFLLSKIAVERVHTEFVKMMMGLNPQRGLYHMLDTNLYKYVPDFKNQLSALKQINQIKGLHLNNENQVWSLICFKFNYNSAQINRMLRDWKSSDQIIKEAQLTCHTLSLLFNHRLTALDMYKDGFKVLKDADYLANVLGLQTNWAKIKHNYDLIPIRHKNELKINGGIIIKKQLVAPGPKLGKIINQLEKLVILRKLPNQTSALLKATKRMSKERKV